MSRCHGCDGTGVRSLTPTVELCTACPAGRRRADDVRRAHLLDVVAHPRRLWDTLIEYASEAPYAALSSEFVGWMLHELAPDLPLILRWDAWTSLVEALPVWRELDTGQVEPDHVAFGPTPDEAVRAAVDAAWQEVVDAGWPLLHGMPLDRACRLCRAQHDQPRHIVPASHDGLCGYHHELVGVS